MTQSNPKEACHICGQKLRDVGGLDLCPAYHDSAGEFYGSLSASIIDFAHDADKVLIECPGATLYRLGTDEIVAGVKFFSDDDSSRKYEIVKNAVFGPHHVRHRWVKREDLHLIRRCQSCQDHTVRMRRKEGSDLYIPSRKNPLPSRRHKNQNSHHQSSLNPHRV